MSSTERTQQEEQISDLPDRNVTPEQEDGVKGGIIIVNSAPSASTPASPLGAVSARFFQEVDQKPA